MFCHFISAYVFVLMNDKITKWINIQEKLASCQYSNYAKHNVAMTIVVAVVGICLSLETMDYDWVEGHHWVGQRLLWLVSPMRE